MKPVISIYVPGVRPHFWLQMYDSLCANDISFELIFVGHIDPPYILPNNVLHLHTPVKPVQCAEIGFRLCQGEYCMYLADDILLNPHALDILYEKTKEKDGSAIFSCTPYINGRRIKTASYRFFPADDISQYREDSPITPLGALYKKKWIRELGGIDRNFVCTAWDIDLAMRFYEQGGICEFLEEAEANEIVPSQSGRLATEGEGDRLTLERFWTVRRTNITPEEEKTTVMYVDESLPLCILKKRTCPVESFVDDNIGTLSQGPKGKWV